MTAEDLKKSKEELEKELKDNDKKAKLFDERYRMARANQFNYQFGTTACFSVFAYVILYFVLGITNYTPANIVPALILGGSITAGTVGTYVMNKLFSIKERLNAFTNAKTDKEKLEEEVKYAIELEKLYSKNQAIKEAIDIISANQDIVDTLSPKYNVNSKNAPISITDAKKRIEELSALLKQKNEELDILSTKRALHDIAGRCREKITGPLQSTMFSLLGACMIMLYVEMPFFLVKDVITLSGGVIFNILFGGIITTSAYMLKRNSDILKVFGKFNSQLEEHSLPSVTKDAYREVQEINRDIQGKEHEISAALIQLQEEKRALEMYTDSVIEQPSEESKSYEMEEELTLPTESPFATKKGPRTLSLTNPENKH